MVANIARAFSLILLGVVLAGVPGRAHAACNLIPPASDRFQSFIGLADRPFVTPGEVFEIVLDEEGCDARSVGLGAPSDSDYSATLAFKPYGAEQAEIVVLTPDCAEVRAALTACEASPHVTRVTCIESTPMQGPVALGPTRGDANKRLRMRFPDTDALVDLPADGLTLTGPVAVAVTRAGDGPVCALASDTCRGIGPKHPFVACVDEFYVGDGSCGLGEDKQHRSFRHFTALPPVNDAAALLGATPAGSSSANSRSEVRLAVDADGIVLLSVDWRAMRRSDREAAGHDGRLRGHDALVALGAMLEAEGGIDARHASLFTPLGRPLPAAYDPDGSSLQMALFDWIDVPFTVLRLAPRLCVAGPRAGRSCVGDAACAGSTCGPARFTLPNVGAPAGRPVVLPAAEETASPESVDPLPPLEVAAKAVEHPL